MCEEEAKLTVPNATIRPLHGQHVPIRQESGYNTCPELEHCQEVADNSPIFVPVSPTNSQEDGQVRLI